MMSKTTNILCEEQASRFIVIKEDLVTGEFADLSCMCLCLERFNDTSLIKYDQTKEINKDSFHLVEQNSNFTIKFLSLYPHFG